MTCEARQEGDEMACACGLRWAVGDGDKPHCRRQRHLVPVPSERRELLIGARREKLNGTVDHPPTQPTVALNVPVELPASLASAMAQSYGYSRVMGRDGPEAMQRAYRLFLDLIT